MVIYKLIIVVCFIDDSDSYYQFSFIQFWMSFIKVKEIEHWGKYSLHYLSGFLKPVFLSERTPIIREGDPVYEMLFVLEGQLLTYSKSERIGPKLLQHGKYCGEELIKWVENDSSSHGHLLTSTKTIIAHTDVEGFTLKIDDLKHAVAVLCHFNRFASFIQSFWKMYKHKRMKRRQSCSHGWTTVRGQWSEGVLH